MKKNINEEIERIKSLFTEERLYGNLIDEEDEKTTENGDEDDPYSMSSAKKLKNAAREKNVKEKSKSKTDGKKDLDNCNKMLKFYNKTFF